MKQVSIIGMGEIGSAIAHVIGKNAEVHSWDTDQTKMSKPATLEETVKDAEIVFLCVPSWIIRKAAGDIKLFIKNSAVIVSLAKGLEEETLKTMDEVLSEVLPENHLVGVLGGPLLAEELIADLPGVGVFGTKESAAFEAIKPLFEGTLIRLEMVNDPRAVAISSVLKNIYAVGLGIAEGLGWGWNGKGWLASKSLEEMNVIAGLFGVDAKILVGAAGGGDFIATAMSPNSYNHETGKEIALTGECKRMSEGCHSIALIIKIVDGSKKDLPFLMSLDQIVNKHEHPKEVFQDLLHS